MGFLDSVTNSVSNTFNRGAAAADRTTRSLKLKSQLSDIAKRRQELTMQLGDSLYEATRENPELRAGREQLFDGIAQCDAERAEAERLLAAIEAEAAAAAASAVMYDCPRCHAKVQATDMFCKGCGLPVAEVRANQPAQAPVPPAYGASQCPRCGAPVAPGSVYCMNCGLRLADAQPAVGVTSEPIPVAAQQVVSPPPAPPMGAPTSAFGAPVSPARTRPSTVAYTPVAPQAKPQPPMPAPAAQPAVPEPVQPVMSEIAVQLGPAVVSAPEPVMPEPAMPDSAAQPGPAVASVPEPAAQPNPGVSPTPEPAAPVEPTAPIEPAALVNPFEPVGLAAGSPEPPAAFAESAWAQPATPETTDAPRKEPFSLEPPPAPVEPTAPQSE